MDPHYVMSRHELDNLFLHMVGCPITFLHSGYEEAFENARLDGDISSVRVQKELELLSTTHGKYVIGGRVIDYFGVPNGGYYAIFYIDDDMLLGLIDQGRATGLSLTHSIVNGLVHPYELTLCILPRRHRAFIYATGMLVSLMRYKGDMISGRIPEPTMIPPVENVDEFDKAMEGIPASVATVIAAKLENVEKLRVETAARMTALEQAKKDSESRAALLEEQLVTRSSDHKKHAEMINTYLQDMRTLMSPKLSEIYSLPAAMSKIDNPNPAISFDGYQTVIAASLTSLREHAAEIDRLNTMLGNRGQKRPQEYDAPQQAKRVLPDDPRERLRMLARENYQLN